VDVIGFVEAVCTFSIVVPVARKEAFARVLP
jgi:hypothetical protein